MLQGVGSLKIRAVLKVIELMGDDLDAVLRIVNQAETTNEFLIAEVAHSDDFWLAIDAKFCGGGLTTCRLDLSPEKWRSYVEGYALKTTYIYPIRRNWNLSVLEFHDEMLMGIRDITRSDFLTKLIIRAPDDMNDGIDYAAVETNSLKVTPGCLGFMLEIFYFNKAPIRGGHTLEQTILFDKEKLNDGYNSMMKLAAAELFAISRRHFDLSVDAHHTGFKRAGVIVPSKLEQVDIEQHLTNAFAEDGLLSIFKETNEMHFRQEHIVIRGLFDGKELNLVIYVTISQLRF